MAWLSRRNCPSFLTANTVAGPLDGAHRSGRAGGHNQDPAAAVLLTGRTHHPQGPPPHPASPPGLALAKPVQCRSRPIACPATPFLTPAPSTGLPNRLADPRQAGPRVSPAASWCQSRPPPALRAVRNHLRAAVAPRTRKNLSRSKPCSLIPGPLIPSLTGTAASPRWIRDKVDGGW